MKPGDIVALAVYQSKKRIHNGYRECQRAYAQRRREQQRQREDWENFMSAGDWSPADELPDPDETW